VTVLVLCGEGTEHEQPIVPEVNGNVNAETIARHLLVLHVQRPHSTAACYKYPMSVAGGVACVFDSLVFLPRFCRAAYHPPPLPRPPGLGTEVHFLSGLTVFLDIHKIFFDVHVRTLAVYANYGVSIKIYWNVNFLQDKIDFECTRSRDSNITLNPRGQREEGLKEIYSNSVVTS
jgi:hypothetical protein